MTKRVLTSIVLFSMLWLPVDARQSQQPAPQRPGTAVEPARGEVAGPAEEKISQTSHALRVNGRDLKYTATAGTLPIRGEDGKVQARMFFVAYTKDGEEARTRPVSFLYNGGPGSATVWLHMGSFAPMHVQMAEEGFQPAPPYRLVENPNTLLDTSDLVFVDAISTGYSRVVEGVKAEQFHGQTPDIRAFGDFIHEYLRVFDRWPSPKYLIGESYGTIRSAGLSQELQSRHGIELNGIVLVSALLTYQTLSPSPQNDIALVAFLPTYTATAWYHKKLPPELSGDLKNAVDEARLFADGEYATALLKGNSLPAADRKAVAQRIARFTGVSADYVERANLRIDPGRFRKELLRPSRLSVGRLDSRFTALDLDAAGESQEFDPSNTALQGAYTGLFADYVNNTLKWKSSLHYDTSGNVRPWTYDQNRYMDTTEALRSAMARNPFLKVFVASGYYDMATPFHGIEINMWHLAYDRAYTDRVAYGYYEAGHMMYIRPSAHKQLTGHVSKFIGETTGAKRTGSE
ncbi:MAG: peptidase S10, partial [Gemmatimonadaceae bacterium]